MSKRKADESTSAVQTVALTVRAGAAVTVDDAVHVGAGCRIDDRGDRIDVSGRGGGRSSSIVIGNSASGSIIVGGRVFGSGTFRNSAIVSTSGRSLVASGGRVYVDGVEISASTDAEVAPAAAAMAVPLAGRTIATIEVCDGASVVVERDDVLASALTVSARDAGSVRLPEARALKIDCRDASSVTVRSVKRRERISVVARDASRVTIN